MVSITDPCELKAPDIYRQAFNVFSKTSRGVDSNWYRAAEELPWQWHLWFDGGREVSSAVFSRQHQRWQLGPSLPLATLTTGEGMSEILGDLMSTKYYQEKPRALGVILHVADEFSLAEIAQAGEAAGEAEDDFQILRYNLIDDPREVLADRDVSVESTSWRLLPFWGAQHGQTRCAAVALSRSREAFLQLLLSSAEKLRMPVRVAVTCAPVEVLAALPLLLKSQVEGGCLVAVMFHKFTAVFAMTRSWELQTVRSLVHRGGSQAPAAFGDILWNMSLAAELAAPKVVIVSADAQALKAAAADLEFYSSNRKAVHFESLSLEDHSAVADLPGHRPEFLVYNTVTLDQACDGSHPATKAETFRGLWSGWARQSFIDTARLDQLYPTQHDLRVLRFSSWLVRLLVFFFIGTGAYGTWSLFEAISHPSWELTAYQMKQTQEKHAKLLEEKKEIDITTRLLKPRSRGWVTLEFLLQLFPEDSGVRLDSFQYNMEAARSPGTVGKGAKPESSGLNRIWTLKGLARPKALQLLSTLNSQRGLSAFFEKVADATGDEACRPAPTRQMTVEFTQGRNPRFNPQASAGDLARDPSLAFPLSFEATITQALSEKDELSLPLDKPF